MYLPRLPIIFLFFLLLIIFCSPQKIFAATFNLSNSPTQIGISDEYPVDVTLSISVADGTIYYLRGAFYKNGTSNYCGYTWNGTEWFNGPYSTQWKNLLKITITNHTWSGQLKAKVDPNDNGCNSSGTYLFRIERFNDTSSDGGGTFSDTQNERTVNIIIPTPTPTSQPTPTNTPLPPTATPTSKPTSTPTPKIPTATPKIFNTPTKEALLSPIITGLEASDSAILGTMSAENIDSPTPTSPPVGVFAGASQKKSFPFVFIIAGFCLLASCGILIFLKTEKGKELWTKFF